MATNCIFERWTVGERPGYAPTNSAQLTVEDLPNSVTWWLPATPFQYESNTDTNTPYILFVHDWNMETWEKDRYAETAFKRLYWQGYQGRFGSFRWPTYYDWPYTTWPQLHYDKSEFNAWKSGAGLRDLLLQLNSEYPGQVRLMAHSMGNIVAGEALRTNTPLVHTYVAMQAAVPSHAYDTNATARTIPYLADDSTPNRYANYWTNGAPCYFNGVAGASRYINFYNTNDWALGWWETDQNTKPDGSAGYTFYPVSGNFMHSGDLLHFPNETYDLFSFCIEARCFALGAQPSVGGVFQIGNQVELDALPYSFGATHKYHSGQFRSDNMNRALFWSTLLQKMTLKN